MLGTINPEILFLQQEDQIKAGLLDMKMILKITEFCQLHLQSRVFLSL